MKTQALLCPEGGEAFLDIGEKYEGGGKEKILFVELTQEKNKKMEEARQRYRAAVWGEPKTADG